MSPGKSIVPDLTEEGIDLEALLEALEKRYLLEALGMAKGVKTEAARLLKLSFRSFRHRLHKYGIK
jgi:two-component system response regulator PilR (NtrC family)